MNKNINWVSEDIIDIIVKNYSPDIRENVSALIKDKKVHEVYVEPGRISSRIVGENKRSQRVVITTNEFSNETWNRLISEVSKSPYLSSLVYNHILPFEVKSIIQNSGDSFIGDIDQYSCLLEDDKSEMDNFMSAAVLEKFADQLISNPFLICTLKGKNIEQFIHEIREYRAENLLLDSFVVSESHENKKQELSLQEFYGSQNSESSFDIPNISVRADELPASILKRLDPVPFDNIDFDADTLLESAYGRVARLSQSLARFLPDNS